MGTALTGLQIGSTYNGLLKTTDNAVINGTLRVITDGLGNNTALEVSTAGVKSSGTLDVTGVATLGAGAILNTPASGNLANCTGYVGTSALVTTGALNSGSITSGFGSIDVGADSISGGAISGTTGTFSGATSISTNDTAFRGRESSGNYRSLVKVNASNVIEIGDANNTNTVPVATDAASLSVAGTVFSGGVAITKKLYVGASIVGAGAISGTTGTFSAAISTAGNTGNTPVSITTTNAISQVSQDTTAGGSTDATQYTFRRNGNAKWVIGNNVDGGSADAFGVRDSTGTIRLAVTSTGLNSTVIGATTPAAGSFTTLGASGLLSMTAAASSNADNASGTYSRWKHNGSNRLIIGTANQVYSGGSTADAAVFEESGSGSLRLGVGSTNVATVSSTGLAVTGTASTTNGLSTSFNNGTNQGVNITETTDASGAFFEVYRKSNSTAIGSVTRVTTTDAVAYNTTSDGRLKENVRDFTAADSGRIIDGLKPRWFDWKASDENGKGIIGFIAQEEAAVDSALVRMGAVTVGDDDPDTVSKQWAVDSGKLVPVLVAEIKSLRARLSAAGIA